MNTKELLQYLSGLYKIREHSLSRERLYCILVVGSFLILLAIRCYFKNDALITILTPMMSPALFFFIEIYYWKAETLVSNKQQLEREIKQVEEELGIKFVSSQYYTKEYRWFFDWIPFESFIKGWVVWPIVSLAGIYFYAWSFKKAWFHIRSFGGEFGRLDMVCLWASLAGMIFIFIDHLVTCVRVYGRKQEKVSEQE